ncbi:unnamed protein product [Closterium sp. NIES-65]|nr:unnamed protein product [Closterium sp. NIES-65]
MPRVTLPTRRPPATAAGRLVLSAILLLVVNLLTPQQLLPAEAARKKPWVGVNLSLSLMSKPIDVKTAIAIVKQRGFAAVKTFYPVPEVLSALAGTGLQVMTSVTNDRLYDFGKSDAAALGWLDEYIVPHVTRGTNIIAIAVGNELMGPGTGYTLVVPAMEALYRALQTRRLHRRVKVVHPQHMGFLANTYPPSKSVVDPLYVGEMRKMLAFLNRTGSFTVLNCYPFFPFKDAGGKVSYDYAMYRGYKGFYDGRRYYQNLMDAMLDGAVWAFEKLGYPNMPYMIGEAGWPTGGNPAATLLNSKRWTTGFLARANSLRGTPKRPGTPIRAFLFELFDEDLKDTTPGQFELHFGLYYANGTKKYELDVLGTGSNLPPSKPPKMWCVRNPTATDAAVGGGVSWACSKGGGGLDCARVGSKCGAEMKATAVYNAWFQKQGQTSEACNFGGTAQVTMRNPSKGACQLHGRPLGVK